MNKTPTEENMNNGRADLHIHSSYSDGSFCPEEIFSYAQGAGLQAISITDHDTVIAADIGLELAGSYDIEFIPGLEISARFGRSELHILGYFIDHKNDELLSYLAYFQEERRKRAGKIVQILKTKGVYISLEEIEEKAAPAAIGRPHIADVLLDCGVVRTYQEAFDKYLGDRCSCHVHKYKITPSEAIQLIQKAGGISFIAHPGLDINSDDISMLIKMGIEGFEAVHPRHSETQISYYQKVISENGLLECGGSDCHGNRKQGPRIGDFAVPYDSVVRMKERMNFQVHEDDENK